MEPWATVGHRVKGISLTAKMESGSNSATHRNRTKEPSDAARILMLASAIRESLSLNKVPFYRRIFRIQGR